MQCHSSWRTFTQLITMIMFITATWILLYQTYNLADRYEYSSHEKLTLEPVKLLGSPGADDGEPPAGVATIGSVRNISAFSDGFHVITMLSLYCGHKWPGYESFTVDELNNRDHEYLTVLKTNLDNPLVSRIHLFFADSESLEIVKSQRWLNADKLTPVKVERRTHMMDFFHYASANLLDKSVIAMNGDIVLGNGFDAIDMMKMRDNKVLYALSRHGHTTANCSTENICLTEYKGSHDAYVFRLEEPLPKEHLLRLDYPINMWQAENGMIYTFNSLFGFKVYNPCYALLTHHYHCVTVHKRGKGYSIKDPPYNWPSGNIGRAPQDTQLLYGEPSL